MEKFKQDMQNTVQITGLDNYESFLVEKKALKYNQFENKLIVISYPKDRVLGYTNKLDGYGSDLMTFEPLTVKGDRFIPLLFWDSLLKRSGIKRTKPELIPF